VGAVSTCVIIEESSGTLDLLLANPVDRRSVLLSKAAGIGTSVVLIAAALVGIAIVGDVIWDTGLSTSNIVAANVGLALLGLCFGGLTMALWAARTPRLSAVRTTAVVAVATYFMNGLGSLTASLAPLRRLSPFFWYLGDDPPLAKGLQPAFLLLLAVAITGTWWAVRRFGRRDLAV